MRLAVYDSSGRLVRILTDGVHRAGSHSILWDGRNGAGQAVEPGVYFYRLQAGGNREMRRMVLAR